MQYDRVSKTKDRLKECTMEKQMDEMRESIGSRCYVEPNSNGALGILAMSGRPTGASHATTRLT